MKLVVGGFAAGKKQAVQKLWGYSENQMSDRLEADTPVFYDLQETCRDFEASEEALLDALMKKEVVICNEVGCGVVPMAAEDRLWREKVGRLCVKLASSAEEVCRVCCGVMMKIKG